MQFAAIPAGSNTLPAVVHLPPGAAGPVAWVLHVPAFADEMNKARPMVHQMATALATNGTAVVIPDLYGCGDAPGEFRDADWHRWRSDIEHVIQWMTDTLGATAITLWGLRLGCLMAADIAAARTDLITGVTFWQPVLDGKLFLNQFLRIRVAASMFKESGETLASLRSEIQDKGHLTVGGYELGLSLYQQLSELNLEHYVAKISGPVEWLEVYEGETPKPSLPAQKLITQWRDHGTELSTSSVKGIRFWATQEIALAPSLIAATLAAFANRTGTRSAPPIEALAQQSAQWTGGTDNQVEKGVVFDCQGSKLTAVYHDTPKGSDNSDVLRPGVVVVVGGPQYRVGSHRHFVQLARTLSAVGYPTLRFDYRGMGDSQGKLVGFEGITADIAAAVTELKTLAPGISGVVLVGLCDAATAITSYASSDARVRALVLMNPWVFSEAGNARAMLSSYYLKRLGSKQFWLKLISGRLSTSASVASFRDNLGKTFGTQNQETKSSAATEPLPTSGSGSLARKMATGLQDFNGKVLLVLSGHDLTADEFRLAEARTVALARCLAQPKATRCSLPDADHTFSNPADKAILQEQILVWLQQL